MEQLVVLFVKDKISVAIIGISAGCDWGSAGKAFAFALVQLYSFLYHIYIGKDILAEAYPIW